MLFKKFSILIIFLTVFFATQPQAWSYNFLYINPTTGAPIGWEPGTTIHYYVDPGSLGRLTNEQARTLIRAAMDIWENASPYANTPRFVYEGLLPEDVDGTNYSRYVSSETCYSSDLTSCPSQAQRDLKTVIVFDQDNTILGGYLCPGGCLGQSRAGVIIGSFADPQSIVQGMIILNGSYASSSTKVRSIVSLMTHELGHLLGLAHTAVNQQIIVGDVTGDDRYIPTMYYYALHTSHLDIPKSQMTPNPDDIAGITTLYPASTASANLGTIKGTITKSNGTPMSHVNVIARKNEDPLCESYSSLTASSCDYATSSSCELYPDARSYQINGISTGIYTIEVEEVADDNLAASLSPSLIDPFISGDAEFWNTDDSVDEQNTLFSTLSVAAGETKENINITLNRSVVTSDRIKYIPLSAFTAGPGTRCPDAPSIDYATLIGVSESTGTGGISDTGDSTTSSGCQLLP